MIRIIQGALHGHWIHNWLQLERRRDMCTRLPPHARSLNAGSQYSSALSTVFGTG
ncbi:hypothetical protein M378DRAFT_173834 [Amanita muscaria Koide BX008]|uniref:Uncharacterized protein n=1 Tax=Amanita muscaria (strain Koide BX008) TaxID=946122 RepID=A0A0C2WEW6_AMAMK|nr:hypothetical protein M378DRAFT_173834 [Amanita muscaria Koide BX008]